MRMQRWREMWRSSSPEGKLAWLLFYLIITMKIVAGILRLAGFIGGTLGDFLAAATWAALGMLVSMVALRMQRHHAGVGRLLSVALLILSLVFLASSALIYLGYLTPPADMHITTIFLLIAALICWRFSRVGRTVLERQGEI